jgi:hypothetical protein
MPFQPKSRILSVLRWATAVAALFLWAASAAGAPFFFSTGDPDGLIATASRPESAGKIEIESADDFVLASATNITGATFTGLVPLGSTAIDVTIEIYRVFPKDSTVPPSGQVPTRVNSPSDVAFDSRDFPGQLNFSTALLSPSFTAGNSVVNGINPSPNQTTGGEGPVTGQRELSHAVQPAGRPLLFRPSGDAGHWRLPVAVGAETDRAARDTFFSRPAELDPQRRP